MVDFNKMRQDAQKELEGLLQQRSALDSKIVGLEQTIKGLDAVCGTDTDPILEKRGLDPVPLPPELQELSSLGLTDAIRKLFECSGIVYLTPTGVRDQLVMYGYELPKENPLAAIHAVLRRLKTNKEITEAAGVSEKHAYRWMSALERAMLAGRFTSRFHGRFEKPKGRLER